MRLEEPGNATPVAPNEPAGSHSTQEFGRFTAFTPVLALDVSYSDCPLGRRRCDHARTSPVPGHPEEPTVP